MDFCGTRILTLYMLYHAIGLGRDIEDQEIENDANHRLHNTKSNISFISYLDLVLSAEESVVTLMTASLTQ